MTALLLVLAACGSSQPAGSVRAERPAAPSFDIENDLDVVEEEVTFDAAGVTVSGTVVRPRGDGRFPAVLVVAGSGPTDRDWQSALLPGTNGSGRLLANALARHGLVVLRFDKRGTGRTPLGGALSWDDYYLAEGRAAVAFLRGLGSVERERLFLVGHSEGGLHALRLAADPDVQSTAIVLLATPGRTLDLVLLGQIETQLRAAQMPDEAVAAELHRIRTALGSISTGEAVDPSTVSELPGIRALISMFTNPAAADAARGLLTFDPVAALVHLDVPAVVLFGDKDVQVNPEADAEPFEEAENAGAFVYHLASSDHVFKEETAPRSSLDATAALRYNADGRVLDPALVPVIVRLLEDLDPEQLRVGRGQNFTRIALPSPLRSLQCALATDRNAEALREGRALERVELGPAEQMWRYIYGGIALDRLGQREKAVRAYRTARSLYPHPMTAKGLLEGLGTLRHLDRMRESCGGRGRLEVRTTPQQAFDALRVAIDERYARRDDAGLDWNALFAEHRQALVSAADAMHFAREAARMLAKARDPAMYLEVDDEFLDILETERPQLNFEQTAIRRAVSDLAERDACLLTGRIGDLGYALIPEWAGSRCEGVGEAFTKALANDFRGATGLIVDVRPNARGNEDNAASVAGHFVLVSTPYAKHEIRDPTAPGGWDRGTRALDPVAPRDMRPVVVLMGPSCRGTNEMFLLMMRAAGATLVGMRSVGDSSRPRPFDLGNGVTVQLPTWRSFQLDGSPVQGVGITPDIEVRERPTRDRDPVLERAITVLRQRPAGAPSPSPPATRSPRP